ncbi:MAG: diguanylate cyclase [Sulfuricurvum sp.]|nr:diguanylate cyclase [Sulfuricurvum sp.]
MDKILPKKIIFQTIFLFIFPAIAIVGLALYMHVSQQENLLIETSAHEKALTSAGKTVIEGSLEGVKNDVEFLSHYHELRKYLDYHQHDAKIDILNDFALLMKHRNSYDQIRWIDETGMEKFRIDYRNGHIFIKQDSELQNKKERYYFKNSAGLPIGSIYVSPFDLNVDQGKLEIPYKPMIRVATPLVDIHGHRRGILIINYLGSYLIEKFQRNTAASYGTSMILNQEGYFLKGETASDEWGFMRHRNDLTLGHRYPEVWARIAREKSGQFEDARGLWTFATVYSQPKTSSQLLKRDDYVTQCPPAQDCSWKVVTFVPANVLYEKLNKHLPMILIAAVVGLFLAGIGSFALAYLYRKKEKSRNDFRELQKKTEGILLSIPDIIMQVDNDKRYVWANTQGLIFFGADVIGHDAAEYFDGEQDTYETVHPLLEGNIDSVYVESWQRRHDGQKRLLGWWCRNLRDEEGNITGALSTARDITQEHERERKMEELSKAVEQIDDIVYMTDKFGNISYVNKAYCTHTGYTREEAIGQNSKISKSGIHDREFYKELWTTILSGEVYRNTLVNKKKNGDLYYEKKTITPLKDDNDAIIGFVSTGKDVTKETMLHQEIERIATIDQLTGIYNRHKFEELFALESERSRRFTQPLSLILIDIDHFKLVNDTYGHDIGDAVLVKLAATVQENIRKIDVFARWGGEEFLLLCPTTDRDNVLEFAEKLRAAVEKTTFPVVGKITISIGVSVFDPQDSLSDLFKRADQGLYYAKENGRNQVGVLD